MPETISGEDIASADRGVVPTGFSILGPKKMPRVDYERIFVLDERGELLGEYVLNDECPVEYADLRRSLPINGLRHLVAFYQGEYAYTPFRVDDLWFIVLTQGVPRIEDRGSIGTLLAAARVHIIPNLAPALARREALLREQEREVAEREVLVSRREERALHVEAELQVVAMRQKEFEAELRAREGKLAALRDYAIRMQRTLFKGKNGAESEPPKAARKPQA